VNRIHGRTEVGWRPGQETSLEPTCSDVRSFGSKCAVLKMYLRHCWDFSAPTQWFGTPQRLGARDIAPHLPPSFTPLMAL